MNAVDRAGNLLTLAMMMLEPTAHRRRSGWRETKAEEEREGVEGEKENTKKSVDSLEDHYL